MWEKAATWHPTDKRKLRFPWGDEQDVTRCNTSNTSPIQLTPVGKYSPIGDSPYGIQDMIGNVWEWTNSQMATYPYYARDGRERNDTIGDRILRGSSYKARRGYIRGSTTRIAFGENYTFEDAGVRLAIVVDY